MKVLIITDIYMEIYFYIPYIINLSLLKVQELRRVEGEGKLSIKCRIYVESLKPVFTEDLNYSKSAEL